MKNWRNYIKARASTARPYILLLILIFVLGFSACVQSADFLETNFLETVASLKLEGGDVSGAKAEIYKYIEKTEGIFSLNKAESDVNKFNALKAGEAAEFDPEFIYVLETADEVAKATDFAFNPYIFPLVELWGFNDNLKTREPPAQEKIDKLLPEIEPKNAFQIEGNTIKKLEDCKIDLGGIAKGYIADKCLEIAQSFGVTKALVNLGGDIAMLGGEFRIGITNPDKNSSAPIDVLELSNTAVATSGNYERFFEDAAGNIYHHILDGKTGRPANGGVNSATVVTKSCMLADALATAFFVNPNLNLKSDVEYEAIFH